MVVLTVLTFRVMSLNFIFFTVVSEEHGGTLENIVGTAFLHKTGLDLTNSLHVPSASLYCSTVLTFSGLKCFMHTPDESDGVQYTERGIQRSQVCFNFSSLGKENTVKYPSVFISEAKFVLHFGTQHVLGIVFVE